MNERIPNLIRKSLMDSLSPSEHTELEEWIVADPINKELYKQVALRYKEDLELKDICQKTNEKKKRSSWTSLKRFFTS